MSLASIAEAVRKDLVTPGVPAIIEMAILSADRQVLYSDLSKIVIDKIMPFYSTALGMSPGDNFSLALTPTRTIILTRFSKKTVLVILTEKVGIALTRTKNTADKFGTMLDESIVLEESKHQAGLPTLETLAGGTPPTQASRPTVEKIQPVPSPKPIVERSQAVPSPKPIVERSQPVPSPPPAKTAVSIAPPTLSQLPPVSGPSPDIVSQAKTIIDRARANGITIRALGSIGIAIHCPSAIRTNPARKIDRIDLVGDASQSSEIENMLIRMGFMQRESHSTPGGPKTLNFLDNNSRTEMEVSFDGSQKYRKVAPASESGLHAYAVSITDLLLAELDVAKISEDDIRDIMAITLDHEAGRGDPEKIDMEYVGELTFHDPDLWRTLSANCDAVLKFVDSHSFPDIDWKMVQSVIVNLLRECRFAHQALTQRDLKL